MSGLRILGLVVALTGGMAMPAALAAQVHQHGEKGQGGKLEIPSSLREEHAEIHARLEAAAALQGPVGEAARGLAQVLHPHFTREEQIALPPLGLLERLGSGAYDEEMAVVLPLTDSLKAELSQMLDEHVRIAEATRRLREVATENGDAAVAALAESLLRHARNEEEVTYPAAVLVGEIVRLREGKAHRPQP